MATKTFTAKTKGQWVQLSTLSNFDFVDGKDYTLQVLGTAKFGDDGKTGILIDSTTPYTYTHKSGVDLYVMTENEDGAVITVSDSASLALATRGGGSGGGSGDAVWGAITGTLSDQTDLANALAEKQDTLTAGSNITINDNIISATDTTYSAFTGATGSVAGSAGLVPAPTATDNDKYLKGDGTWAAVSGGGSGLQNTATGNGSLTILGTPASSHNALNIGISSEAGDYSVAIGSVTGDNDAPTAYQDAVAIGWQAQAYLDSVAVGYSANAGFHQSSENSVAIGSNANTNNNNSIAIGYSASINSNNSIAIGSEADGSGAYGIAIGSSSSVGGNYSIALGCGAVASSNYSFYVGFGFNNDEPLSYKLLDGTTGKIPNDRLNAFTGATSSVAGGVGAVPAPTTSDVDKYLKGDGTWATVSGGGLPSQTGNSGKFLTTDGTDASWVTVDSLPSQTGNSGKYLTTNGTTASWATVSGGGLQNTATGSESLTILGTASSAMSGTNVGVGSQAGDFGATAFGKNAKATTNGTLALGCLAEATDIQAYQIGWGTNDEGKTLYIGWGTNDNYKLLDGKTGKIPNDRIDGATGSFTSQDGKTVTVTNGVITSIV